MSDMMTTDQRIAMLAGLIANDWKVAVDDEVRADARRWMGLIFPELFDGSAWVAPMEPTEAMRIAWGETMPVSAVVEWRTLRDAHLKGLETDAKVEG